MSENPDLDGVASAVPSQPQWVVQNYEGTKRRLGQVVTNTGDRVTIDFRDGDTVDWPKDDLPKSARFIDEGSLEWRSLAHPDELIAEFARDPGSVMATILHERRKPLEAGDFKFRLLSLGLLTTDKSREKAEWIAVWRTGRRTLLGHVNVADQGRTFAWSDTPLEKATTSKSSIPRSAKKPSDEVVAAIRQLGRQSTGSADKEVAKKKLRAAHESKRLNSAQVAAAMAGRAIAERDIDWTTVRLGDEIPDGLLDQIMELATRQGAITWVLEAVTASGSQLVADAALAALRPVSPMDLQTAAVERFETLRLGIAEGKIAAAESAKILDRVGSVLKGAPSSELVDVTIGLLAIVTTESEPAEWHRSVTQLAQVLGAATPEDVGTALGSHNEDAMVRVGASLAGLGFEPDAGRLTFLRAVALNQPAVFGAGEATSMWAGLQAAHLHELTNAGDALAEALTSRDGELADSVTVPAIVAHLQEADLGDLLAVATWPTPLQQLVSVADWRAAIEKSDRANGLLTRALAEVRSQAE